MGITQILFWVLSILALLSAILVVISKNPVHSVLWLIAVFIAISGHYILLNAQFLAIVNLIVYAGAIMVLFLFVFMLMNLNSDTEPQKNKWLKIAGVVAGGSLLLVLVAALKQADMKGQLAEMNKGDIGLIKNLGMVLFQDYVVPFEISSVLFLSAMVGVVVIGKKD
ncbi:NADH-quinone oxidoreductase subunit J [Flavitalea sp. BT771]|uniref:NADH-quinone oxidoreductase subunit J family protein n=1 Tax=Flavitalea sp. BT771 TaxID=3063329 RepID=UPI0026E2EC4F|nr:NADH-quinone oxidoreductase subunit J [Flavitalea sp. BT771]MDO6433239.1 NADH-quinone oxidoreductase subunit J [Flavitalea sp. BT771]MDV6221485.1 NADH-quinone oxidoreductase subunit J [Flavitalea sp. BT771]